MGFRFQKRITIVPGVRLNISKSGVSTSFGPKGASLNVGKNGVKGTVGIPGSGMSYSKQLVNSKGQSTIGSSGYAGYGGQSTQLPVPAGLMRNDVNKIVFIDSNGQPFDHKTQLALKKEYANEHASFTESTVREINFFSNNLKDIVQYYELPDFFREQYRANPFPEREPNFQEISDSMPNGFFNFKRNENAQLEYQRALEGYNLRKQEWDSIENQKVYLSSEIQRLKILSNQGDIISMERFLEKVIQQMNFPHPIDDFSYEFEGSTGLWLDIDLPEIESLPNEVASITANGSISIKKKTKKQLKEEYTTVVSSVANILAVYIFTLFPTIDAMVISGRTQRVRNGIMSDDYIYSLHITRDVISNINFYNSLPITLLSYYNPIMNLSKTDEWKPINPYFKEV